MGPFLFWRPASHECARAHDCAQQSASPAVVRRAVAAPPPGVGVDIGAAVVAVVAVVIIRVGVSKAADERHDAAEMPAMPPVATPAVAGEPVVAWKPVAAGK